MNRSASPGPAVRALLEGSTLPADATPPIRALWHGLRGDWQAAHEIIQVEEDRDSAWVHAWLHRIEGDLSNAGYWYGRAGRSAATGDTRSEAFAIGAELSATGPVAPPAG